MRIYFTLPFKTLMQKADEAKGGEPAKQRLTEGIKLKKTTNSHNMIDSKKFIISKMLI